MTDLTADAVEGAVGGRIVDRRNRLSGERDAVVARFGETLPGVRMAGTGVAVAAADPRLRRPAGHGNRGDTLAETGTEERGQFVQRQRGRSFVVEAFERLRAGPAEEALDDRHSQRPEGVTAGFGGARIAGQMRVMRKFLAVLKRKHELVRQAQRELTCGLKDVVDRWVEPYPAERRRGHRDDDLFSLDDAVVGRELNGFRQAAHRADGCRQPVIESRTELGHP